MDATVFTTLGVGVRLAAIVLTGQRSLRTEIAAVETRLGKRISELRAEMTASENRLRGEISAVETRLGTRIERLEERVNGLDSRFSELRGGLSAVFAPLRRRPLPDPTPDESPA